jgi:hypothetical protein
MKLTNYHRQAFVSSVMNDVPKVDYQRQFQAAVEEDMIAVAHPKIAAVLKDKNLRHVLFSGYHRASPKSGSGLSSVSTYRDYEPSNKAATVFAEISELAKLQKEKRNELEAMVTGVIKSCSTLKDAQERLPEFVKYLPEEATKGTMLPAIANLAAELMKAGWPAGKGAVAA